MYTMALGQVFPQVLLFFPVTIISQERHSFIHNSRYTIVSGYAVRNTLKTVSAVNTVASWLRARGFKFEVGDGPL
jgi:hypothetical protein